jgi:cytidylate kinase
MAIITMTRGSLSATARVVEKLSERLGYRALSREEAISYAEKHGIEEFRLGSPNCMENQPPKLWDRHAAQRHHYLVILKAALMDFVVEGNLIYHGNLGQYILSDVPKLLRIRVDADFDSRVRFLMEERGLTRSEAEAHIADIDTRRTRWVKFLYGLDFTDSANYDLILNMAKLSPDMMADVIADLITRGNLTVNDKDRHRLRDLHLESIVQAHLVRSPRTRGMQLEVSADSETGEVIISGIEPMLGTDIWQRDIREVAAGIEGVSKLSLRVSQG